MPPIVLNESNKDISKDNIDKIDQDLKKAINNLKGDFYDLDTGKVNYQKMNSSDSFKEYQEITEKLKNFNLKL